MWKCERLLPPFRLKRIFVVYSSLLDCSKTMPRKRAKYNFIHKNISIFASPITFSLEEVAISIPISHFRNMQINKLPRTMLNFSHSYTDGGRAAVRRC